MWYVLQTRVRRHLPHRETCFIAVYVHIYIYAVFTCHSIYYIYRETTQLRLCMAARSVSIADPAPTLIIVCRLPLICDRLGQYLTTAEISRLEGAARSVSIAYRQHPLIAVCSLPLVCDFLGQYLTPLEIHTLEGVHWWISADLRWHLLGDPPVNSSAGSEDSGSEDFLQPRRAG